MKICVFGLWHLGCVTAACLANEGHDVVGLDFNMETIEKLQAGTPPLYEPGLKELLQANQERLVFTTNPSKALAAAQVLWVTFDTPVDEDDRADAEAVIREIDTLFPYLKNLDLVLISSQLPVGTTTRIAQRYQEQFGGSKPAFAYSPENLRLGKAIASFTSPDRVVVGVSEKHSKPLIADMLSPITDNILWMSVESAEMTKHALNAFLATSVTFINEIATICEQVGADAHEVERGLKSDSRVGEKAYLKPGSAFAGGTLARDVRFLQKIGSEYDLPVHLMQSISRSNTAHQEWAFQRLKKFFGNLAGKTIAVLGLTYKPGTNTLRRSSAISLIHKLIQEGANVKAHDPVVSELPEDLSATLCKTVEESIRDADALVLATEWPEYKKLKPEIFLRQQKKLIVLDANRFLAESISVDEQIQYFTVGKP